MMAIGKVDLVFDEFGEIVHDVGIVEEDFVVDQGVDDLDKFGMGDERLSCIGGWLELDSCLFWIVDLEFMEEILCDVLEDL